MYNITSNKVIIRAFGRKKKKNQNETNSNTEERVPISGKKCTEKCTIIILITLYATDTIKYRRGRVNCICDRHFHGGGGRFLYFPREAIIIYIHVYKDNRTNFRVKDVV